MRRTTATAVVAVALVPSVGALRGAGQREGEDAPRNGRKLRLRPAEERELMHFTVEFEECKGRGIQKCEELIQKDVDKYPGVFEGRDHLNYEVHQVRTHDQPNYYKVGLRTNVEETGVVGVNGDGLVYYPWQWCKTADDCYDIGPWDCNVGTPLTVRQCCKMIRATVPDRDVNGHRIDCYASPPIGSASNPEDKNRVLIHVKGNQVVGAPKNE